MKARNFGTKRALVLVVAVALLLGTVIGGTIAWLTAQTEPVTNTFVIGDITLSLAESTGSEYPLSAGQTVDKDPTVTVGANSVDCWVFVKVDESEDLDKYITYEMADGWTALEGEEGVYYYDEIVKMSETPTEISVLKDDQVTGTNFSSTELADYEKTDPPKLTFTAYAIQSVGIADAATAWAALNP